MMQALFVLAVFIIAIGCIVDKEYRSEIWQGLIIFVLGSLAFIIVKSFIWIWS